MLNKTVSHYEILEKLGEGGMGVVYKAHDTRLKREVALKFLLPQVVGGGSERARLTREAQAAAGLNHPHICTVYEIDEFQGQLFIAMEYVAGQSLKERIATGPLGLAEVIEIASQVAEALQEAHGRGIVHRDIKPANVMVTPKGQAKVMDFGLAKSGGAESLTRTGTTVGTVAYMSPEQASGGEIDHRTDIWSLGIMIYELLTGRLPFRGDNEQATLYAMLNKTPDPLTAVRTGVPMELERIVGKCIQKDPALRYQHADDLLADLRTLRQATATQTLPSMQVKRREGRKWPWFAGAAIVVALVAVLSQLGPWLRSPNDAVTPQDLARGRSTGLKKIVVLPFENLGPAEDAYFAAGMTEEITSRLAVASGLGVISRTSAVQYDRTGKRIADIGEDLRVDYVLEGTVRWSRGEGALSRVRVTLQLIRVSDDTHIWADTFDRVLEDVFAVQSEVAEKTIRQLGVALLESERRSMEIRPTEDLVAYQAYLRGLDRIGASGLAAELPEEELREAARMFEQAVRMDSSFALAYVGLAQAHRRLYFDGHDQTDERRNLARAAIERAVALQPDNPLVRIELGYYYYNCHLDYDRALREFTAAAVGLPNDPRLLSAIGFIWRRQGLWPESIRIHEQAFDLDPRNGDLAAEIGTSDMRVRNYAEAQRWYERALAIEPTARSPLLYVALNHFLWRADTKRVRAAIEATPFARWPILQVIVFYTHVLDRNYEAALRTLESLPPEPLMNQHDISLRAGYEGNVYLVQGRTAEAHRLFTEALTVLDAMRPSLPNDNRLVGARARVLAGLGAKREAIAEARRAVELAAPDAFRVGDRQADLVRVLVTVGELDAALVELERGLSAPGLLSVAVLRVDPAMDLLRDKPEFRRLLEEYAPREP